MDPLPVSQPTVSKHRWKRKELAPTSGLTSSFLQPPLESWGMGLCFLYSPMPVPLTLPKHSNRNCSANQPTTQFLIHWLLTRVKQCRKWIATTKAFSSSIHHRLLNVMVHSLQSTKASWKTLKSQHETHQLCTYTILHCYWTNRKSEKTASFRWHHSNIMKHLKVLEIIQH